VKIPPRRGGDFQKHEVISSDACFWMLSARGSTPAQIRIGSMSPTRLVCRFAYRIGQLEAKRNLRAAPDLSEAKDIEVVMREVKTVLQARLELAASRQMTSRLTGALFLVKRRACNRLRLSQRVETE